MKNEGTYNCLFYAVIAALGGLLFGYNTSVISGALLFLKDQFALSTFFQGLVVSMVLIGALFGAFFNGIATNKGRRKALFITCGLYALGAFLFVVAQSIWMVLLGRFISGLGLGLSSVSVPLYISEISPPKNRGAFVSINQLAITIGILLGYILDYSFASHESWRAMIGFQFVFLLLFFLLLFIIPESPSFLASLGRVKQAKNLKERLGHDKITGEGEIVTRKLEKEKKARWSKLFQKPLSIPFTIAIALSVFQIITGINTVIYYAPQIFIKAGFVTAKSAILATLSIGVINVFVTIASLFLIDKVGRRPLLLAGLLGMAISLATLGSLFHLNSDNAGIGAIICLFFYVAFFAFSIGPIAWLIISEIFPLEIRGKAMGAAISLNWIANILISLTFLSLIENITIGYTFYLFALISTIASIFVYFYVFETKGKTFAEIQKHYSK